jgi:RimJ/RimL family protein N-acetyltransferase
MGRDPELRTERLVLRRWREPDRDAFAALNADPAVMEHLSKVLTREESDEFADRIEDGFEDRGYGLWAVEVIDGAPFIGFVGLSLATFEAPFTPAVEVGWRLAREHWGHGYATEAGRASLDFAFDVLELDEVLSFTVPANRRSWGVMERLGLRHDPADDFDHPNFPPGHRLRRHLLYRASR